MKTGGCLIKHARYYWLTLAESHLTRRLFGAMVRRIAALPVATGVGGAGRLNRRKRKEASEECARKSKKTGKLPVFKFWSKPKVAFGGASTWATKEVEARRIKR